MGGLLTTRLPKGLGEHREGAAHLGRARAWLVPGRTPGGHRQQRLEDVESIERHEPELDDRWYFPKGMIGHREPTKPVAPDLSASRRGRAIEVPFQPGRGP